MPDRRWTRREVIRSGAVGAAGLAVARSAGPALGAAGANERIRVGIVGPGDRGEGLIRDFFECNTAHNAQLVAVCDLWNYRRETGRARVLRHGGAEPAIFRNTDELYAARAVDAVIIATPDFSHARLCAEAVRAGLDVYVEKPLANTIEDANFVRAACVETGKTVQVGTGSRSEPLFQAAAEFVRSGAFGKVNGAELCWNVNQPKRWRREELVPRLKEQDTDWERYQLNRPRHPFDARRYLEFRLFWPYSSGLPDQWMSHQIDLLHMITGESHPSSCVASGAICQWHDGRENPDTFGAVFEYPGFQARYTARQTNSHGGMRELLFSNRGTLDVQAGEVTGEGGIGIKEGGTGDRLETRKLEPKPALSHMANWLQCIRDRKQPNADIHAGYGHSVAVAMAIRAMQTGRRIRFDADTREFHEA